MRITHLELHNIKSYAGPVRIDLTSGLNAVCGLNGSGKTTVLEAIGFALFNYLPYSQQAFIREGEKSGTVRVGILARDGRQYEVVRKVGSGAAQSVADMETGTRIAERKDTLTWIREKALDIDGDVDLESLFKNAVGVPQGTMTADFKGSGITRKSVFDPLLRVEEYRQAFEYLRETLSFLRQRTAQVDQEIAVLRVDADQIPSKQEARTAQEAIVTLSEARLATLIEHRNTVELGRQELDALQDRLRTLEAERRGAEYDVRRESDFLRERQARLHEAEEARTALKEAQLGYETVIDAREKLTSLERHRIERDENSVELAAARIGAQGIIGQIQQLDQERDRARRSADEAAQLVESVVGQDALERELHSVRLVVREVEGLDGQLGRLGQEIATLERTCLEREDALRLCREAQRQLERLPETQAAFENRCGQLAQLEPLKERQEVLQREGLDLRARRDRLAGDVSRRELTRRQAITLLPTATALDAHLSRQLDLRERRARVLAAIEYQGVARADLRRNQCPLLELQCPVVTADPAMLDSFDAHESELQVEGQVLESELATVAAEAEGARAAAVSLQRLEVELAGLEKSSDELTDVERRLLQCREEYQKVSQITCQEQAWKSDHSRLHTELGRLRVATRTAGGLLPLEEQDRRDRQVLDLQRQELQDQEATRAALKDQAERAGVLEIELAVLDDPRSKQQGLLAVAARQQEIENRLVAEQKRLGESSGRVKALLAEAQRFEALDEMLAEQRVRERDHADDYDRYLQCQSDAAQIEERRHALRQNHASLAAATARLQAVIEKIGGIQTSYDAATHAELRKTCDEAGKDVVRESTVLDHARRGLEQAENELAQLRLRENRLRIREGERLGLVRVGTAIGFIRDTIRAAGPAVTESLLATISIGANEIYAEIMDDHAVELRWDRDYEILVQRGAETRTFAQLSGGEQMSAALAVRLALLREMSEVDFALFDEPTQNMDGERRGNLADQIRAVRGFDQLIIISHDDTFEHHTDHLIRLQKVNEETEVH